MADEQRLKPLGKIVLFLFIIGCFAGAYYLFPKKGAPSAGAKPIDSGSSSSGGIFSRNVSAEIGVAYGTEKQRWLEWAVQEFAKTSEGKQIKVNLIPMGSIEGAHALLGAISASTRGPRRAP